MDYINRREEILRILEQTPESISASRLAARFGVTRQVIVSDVALLRATGRPIVATRSGYRLEKSPSPANLETILCRHSAQQVLDEFYAVVDNGGSVVSVLVEHPIYGEISAEINIASRYDAQEFVRRMQSAHAAQLSDLTGGLHVHTIRVPDAMAFERIITQLRHLGILVEES